MTIFYSNEEPLSKYFPITLHVSPATRILNENPAQQVQKFCQLLKYCPLFSRRDLIFIDYATCKKLAIFLTFQKNTSSNVLQIPFLATSFQRQTYQYIQSRHTLFIGSHYDS